MPDAPAASPAATVPAAAPKPSPKVQALLDQAQAALDASKLADAESLLQQALDLSRSNADLVGQGRALFGLGRVYLTTGRSSAALDSLQQALSIFHMAGDERGEASALNGLGNVYNSTGRPSDALTAYQKALALFRFVGDKRGEASALSNSGYLYRSTGRPSDALAAFQEALLLYRAAGNPDGEAVALLNSGAVFNDTGHPTEALIAFQQALPLFRSAGDKEGEANVLLNTGVVHTGTGDPSNALKLFEQALPLLRSVRDRDGECKALQNMGDAYFATDHFSDALTSWQAVLSLYRDAGVKSGEAQALTGIGNVYFATDRPRDALNSYQQALPIYRSAGDKDGEGHVLTNIGAIFDGIGRPSEALLRYQEALPLLRAVGDKKHEAVDLMNMGAAYDKMGRLSDALKLYEQALPLYRAVNDKTGEALSLVDIGVSYRDQGHAADALIKFEQAIPLFRAAGNREGEASGLYRIANIESKRGDRIDALRDYAQSIAIVEQIRTNLGGLTASKQSYLASKLNLYTGYLDCLLSDRAHIPMQATTALSVAEQSKARALLDLLDAGQVDLTASLTDDERLELRELKTQANTLNARMVKEGVENNVGAKLRFAELQRQQTEVEAKLQRLSDSLYAKHPDLAVKRCATIATAADLAPVLDKKTALLEYVQTTPDHIALFVVTNRGRATGAACQVSIRYLKIPANLAADCAAFQSACADPRKEYTGLSAGLYRSLVAPAADELSGKTRLIVCPDGPLWNVPFQALTDRHGFFLADRFEIDYAYSATGALAAHNARRRQQNMAPHASEGSLLVVANPAFGDSRRFGDLDDLPGQRPLDKPSRPIEKPSRPIDKPSRPIDKPSRPIDKPSRPLDTPSRPLDTPSRPIEMPSRAMADVLARGGRIAPLPGTQQEADALHHLFPDARILLGVDAQATTVRKDAANYRFLHFATHGFFNDAAPMLSSLVLAQPDAAGKAAGDNGFLTARDFFDLGLPRTEMVTLSACNSGRGQIQSGEGVIGLTWALFAAGCPTEVVSQWSVDDACTATLMTKFYTQLKAGKPRGVALRDAVLATAHDGSPAHHHPYYWAPFVLFGAWR